MEPMVKSVYGNKPSTLTTPGVTSVDLPESEGPAQQVPLQPSQELTPEQQAEVAEAQFYASQGEPTAEGQLTPEQQAEVAEAQFYANQPGPVSTGGLSGLYGVVEMPDGSFRVHEDNGKLRELTSGEKSVASFMAKAQRVAAPIAGGVAGGVAGAFTGPAALAATPALAGIGAATASTGVHPIAQQYERMAGEKPQERNDMAVAADLLAPLAGEVATLAGFKLLAQKAPGVAAEITGALEGAAQRAAIQAETRGTQAATGAGEAFLQAEAAKREKLFKDTGVTPTKGMINEEISPEIVAKEGEIASGAYGAANKKAMKEAHAQAIQQTNRNADMVLDIFGKKNASGQQAKSFGEAIQAHQQIINSFKRRVYGEVKNRQFDIPVLETFRKHMDGNLFDESGRLTTGRIQDAEQPLVRMYEKIQEQISRETSPTGFGQQGGKPPVKVVLEDVVTPTEQVQPGMVGLEQPGQSSGIAEQRIADAQVQPAFSGMTVPSSPRVARYLSPNEAGQGTRGLTLPQIDRYILDLGKRANFNSKQQATPSESAARQIYHDLVEYRDAIVEKTLSDVGQGDLAGSLRASRTAYSQNVGGLRMLDQMLAGEPENWAKTFRTLMRSNPKKLGQVVEVMSPEQVAKVRTDILATIMKPDEISGRRAFSAARKEYESYDTKAKQILFGDEWKDVDNMLKVGSLVENYGVRINPEKTKPVADLISLLSNKLHYLAGIVTRFLPSNQAGTYIKNNTAIQAPRVQTGAPKVVGVRGFPIISDMEGRR